MKRGRRRRPSGIEAGRRQRPAETRKDARGHRQSERSAAERAPEGTEESGLQRTRMMMIIMRSRRSQGGWVGL